MPFLAVLLGMQTATPLVALVSTLISLMILVRNWHLIDFRLTWRLIAAACGVPVGLFYLTRVPESVTQVLLGLLLIGFSLYNLRRSSHSQMRVSHHTAYATFAEAKLRADLCAVQAASPSGACEPPVALALLQPHAIKLCLHWPGLWHGSRRI